MILFWLLGVFAAMGVLAYVRSPLLVWTVVAGLFVLALGLFGLAPEWVVIGLTSVYTLVAVVMNVLPLRRALITKHIFTIYRRMLPGMSDTEREAIEAGNVWWDADLFSGNPDWSKLLKYPEPKLTAEEQAFLDGPVEELCAMLDDWVITHELHDLPPEVWQFIKDKGFFGMIIPKRYGGLEFSALAHSAVIVKVAARSMTAGVTIMVPNSLGPGELLLHYGTDEQKDHYLPRLARGQEVPCFALTGPDAGSDAGAMPDTGIICRQTFEGKEDVLGILLNWDKRYITLCPVATVLGLAFKLYDPDHLLGDTEDIGITCALIPTSTPGVETGRRHHPTGTPFQNGPTTGKDVFIPMDWVIGGTEYVGQGWRMLMESLAVGRSISLPGLSAAAGKFAAYTVGAYARIRKQFKMPIGHFGGVEEVLARIGGMAYAMDAARILTLGAVDSGEKPSVISAIIKYHLTERMRIIINDSMDIFGGKGICQGPKNFLATPYQALPISITVEGANILTRSMIIFGQGAIRCHPYVLQEMQAAADEDTVNGLKVFDRAIIGHIGFLYSNLVRTKWLAWTGSRLVKTPASAPAKRYYQQLTRMSATFALTADVVMLTLGGSLKRREKISARLGDMLSELYIASAALKRFEDQGRQVADEVLLRYACESALLNIQEALDDLLRNFPNRIIATALRLVVFPLGRPYRGASDRLGHRVAQLIMAPSEARDRLSEGVYLPDDINEPVGQLKAALHSAIAAEPVERKMYKALKAGSILAHLETPLVDQALAANVIDEREAHLLRTANKDRAVVIAVDDFSPDEITQENTVWQAEQEKLRAGPSM